jgi:hypothetical protein
MWVELTESTGLFVHRSSEWTQNTVDCHRSGTYRVHCYVFLWHACHECRELEGRVLSISTHHSLGREDVSFQYGMPAGVAGV